MPARRPWRRGTGPEIGDGFREDGGSRIAVISAEEMVPYRPRAPGLHLTHPRLVFLFFPLRQNELLCAEGMNDAYSLFSHVRAYIHQNYFEILNVAPP